MTHSRRTWDDTWLDVAAVVARRSLCVRDQVGAVVVDPRNRVVATGYNGPPDGFEHGGLPCVEWCRRASPSPVESWRLEPSTIPYDVEYDGDVAYLVWRGHRVELTDENLRRVGAEPMSAEPTSDYSDCPSLHAEANALSVCDRSVREGGTIYVTSQVCHACAKLVANSGLSTVVVRVTEDHPHRNFNESHEFLERCGLTVVTA